MRVSRTYRLPDVIKQTPITSAGLSGLADLAGVNFAGSLKLKAELYFTISFGVDTGGFYMVPGNGVEARLAVGGNVTAAVGPGTAKGNASLGFDARVVQTTTASDGRIRLADLANFADFTSAQLGGSAAINVEATMPIRGTGGITFAGDWYWDLAPDASGFIYDSVNSGFDTEGLLNSLADAVGVGINRLSDQAEDMLVRVDKIGLIGDELTDLLKPIIQDKLRYNNDLGSVRAYLADRGIQIVTHVSPQDFISGSYATQDLIRLQYDQVVQRDQPLQFSPRGEFTFPNGGGTNVTLSITSGQVTIDPTLTFSMQFGLDTLKGPFVVEGASLTALLPITVATNNPLIGKLSAGNLVNVNASASGNIQASASYRLIDSDNTAGEKFSLREYNLAMENNKNQQNTNLDNSTTASADFNLDLSLSVTSQQSLPEVVRTMLTENFNWQAKADYHWPAETGSYHIVTRPSFPNIATSARQRFFQELDEYNPLPKEFREFLATPLPFFEKSIPELLNFTAGAKTFLDSDSYEGENVDDPKRTANGSLRTMSLPSQKTSSLCCWANLPICLPLILTRSLIRKNLLTTFSHVPSSSHTWVSRAVS